MINKTRLVVLYNISAQHRHAKELLEQQVCRLLIRNVRLVVKRNPFYDNFSAATASRQQGAILKRNALEKLLIFKLFAVSANITRFR